jgi:hypothetical protein
MSQKTRSYWQILVVAVEHGAIVPLNCNECFLLLEHIGELAMLDTDERFLMQAVSDHQDRCPDCREHHLERFKELETQWLERSFREM